MQNPPPEPERLTLLDVPDATLSELLPLLGEGVGVFCRQGQSMASFLTQTLGLSRDIVGDEIEAVYCDGGKVDDLQEARLHDGAQVALSGSNPGPVDPAATGAAPLEALQTTATTPREGGRIPQEGPQALVWVVAGEALRWPLARLLLRQGVLLSMERMDALLHELSEQFWQRSRGILIKGRRLDPLTHELGLPQSEALITLEVRAPQETPPAEET